MLGEVNATAPHLFCPRGFTFLGYFLVGSHCIFTLLAFQYRRASKLGLGHFQGGNVLQPRVHHCITIEYHKANIHNYLHVPFYVLLQPTKCSTVLNMLLSNRSDPSACTFICLAFLTSYRPTINLLCFALAFTRLPLYLYYNVENRQAVFNYRYQPISPQFPLFKFPLFLISPPCLFFAKLLQQNNAYTILLIYYTSLRRTTAPLLATHNTQGVYHLDRTRTTPIYIHQSALTSFISRYHHYLLR